jgi:prepilin-type N-terminal cleavage/methylation domain-containing protein
MKIPKKKRPRTPGRSHAKRGFTLIEIGIVIALVALLASLGLVAINGLQSTAKLKNIAGDLTGTLAHARSRATARQRTQLIVFDAVTGTNKTYGFYHYEDAAASPNIFAPGDLDSILQGLTPSDPTTAPAPYLLRKVDTNFQDSLVATSIDPFLRASNALAAVGNSPAAWGGSTLPFPFAAVSTNTNFGCSFCNSIGKGAVAFLATGRAIFNSQGLNPDPNLSGALVMFRSINPKLPVSPPNSNVTSRTGVAVSPSGFFQKLVPQ